MQREEKFVFKISNLEDLSFQGKNQTLTKPNKSPQLIILSVLTAFLVY